MSDQSKSSWETILNKKEFHANPERIQKVDLNIPGKLAFVLENVFTPQESQGFIDMSEKDGYEMALVNVGLGRQQKMEHIRNGYRHIRDDTYISEQIYERIQKYLPEKFDFLKVKELNERLRFLRYDNGEYFKPHN
eukprot:Awhi_evm1s301